MDDTTEALMRLAVHLCSRSLATTSTVLACGSTFTHRPSSVFPCVQCTAHRRQRRTGCRVAPPPKYLTCRGRPLLTTPQYFRLVFYFWYFYKVYHTTTTTKWLCWLSKSAAFVPATPNPDSRTRPQPAIDHYGAVSTFHDDNICETRFRSSAPAVWNSLPQTVLSSDSVAVFKLRLKTFLFSQAFSSFSAH